MTWILFRIVLKIGTMDMKVLLQPMKFSNGLYLLIKFAKFLLHYWIFCRDLRNAHQGREFKILGKSLKLTFFKIMDTKNFEKNSLHVP